MKRREFLTLVGGAAAAGAWPLRLRAQQPALPVVAFVNTGSAEGLKNRAVSFRKGLSEVGFVEGKDVTIEYHWLEGRTDQLADRAASRRPIAPTPPSTARTARARGP